MARKGCVLIMPTRWDAVTEETSDGDPHIAIFDPYLGFGTDEEGYAAYLDMWGKMGVRVGTDITFSGSGRPEPATPERAEACGVATQMWIPEAQSHTPDGRFDAYGRR